MHQKVCHQSSETYSITKTEQLQATPVVSWCLVNPFHYSAAKSAEWLGVGHLSFILRRVLLSVPVFWQENKYSRGGKGQICPSPLFFFPVKLLTRFNSNFILLIILNSLPDKIESNPIYINEKLSAGYILFWIRNVNMS